jgi:hypothetical protein
MEMEAMEVSVFQLFVAYINKPKTFVFSQYSNVVSNINIRMNRCLRGKEGSALQRKA